MKTKNFLLVAALFLGSLVFNSADALAQDPPITPVDTSYHNGVEKYVGGITPGLDYGVWFRTGFVAPANTHFGPNAASLADSTLFFVRDVNLNTNRDTVNLTVLFYPKWINPLGDYVDTLTINVFEGEATPFVLPLRATAAPFSVSPLSVSFSNTVAGSDTSKVAEPVTVSTVDQNLEDFTYYLTGGANSAFFVEPAEEASLAIKTLTWNIWFAPPFGERGGKRYYDTLVVSHNVFPNLVYKIPVQGTAIPIKADPNPLLFRTVEVNHQKPLKLTVTTQEHINSYTIVEDSLNAYSVQASSDWDPERGGTLEVTFAPTTEGPSYALLQLAGVNNDTLRVSLEGRGGNPSVLSAVPNSHNFGDAPVEQRVVSPPILVVLTYPVNHLTDPGSFTFDEANTAFRLETLQQATYTTVDSVYITVSFKPSTIGLYESWLTVHAEDADNIDIQLLGSAYNPPVPPDPGSPAASPEQATVISVQEAATVPAVWVKEGDITVANAPDGSVIQVYSLQGTALKTQAVSSDKEILKTASFPRSVYIVLVNDRKEVILRQKVVL